MDQPAALAHLQQACVPANPDPNALIAEWTAAAAALGAPIPSAGLPALHPIAAAEQAHIAQLSALPWIAPYLTANPGASFALVEIDPLLAYQASIDNDRSDHHCHALGRPPTMTEMMEVCLPLTQPSDTFTLQNGPGAQSMLLRARSLNVRAVAQGFVGAGTIGVQFNHALPLTHVVRHNGRCYLHNGFHRALGLRAAGATVMPCLFRDVATPEEVGIGPSTFQLALLESADPPTVGHFTQGRAHPVQLRAHSKIIHVSWAEHVVPEE
jgi:hypothetical protein